MWGGPPPLRDPELPLSVPRRARLEVLAPAPRALTAKTPFMSLSMDGHYQRGTLVYVPTGQAGGVAAIFSPIEFQAGLADRVALTPGYPSPRQRAGVREG